MTLRLGTRDSALARAQATAIVGALGAIARSQGRDIRFELHVVTTGTNATQDLIDGGESQGEAVVALREALSAGDCDLVVHALTDLPLEPCEGLKLAAMPIREDSREALCAQGVLLNDLPHGARVGADSPRCAAQLLAIRPDLNVVAIYGDVQAQLAMVGQSLDAVVVAVASLKRLGLLSAVSEVLAYDAVVPAPGQGALAIETRIDADADLATTVALLDDPATRATTTAEREVLRVLGLEWSRSVGAHAALDTGRVKLTARVTNATGTLQLTEINGGPVGEAQRIGMLTAHSLLGRGAKHMMGFL